MSAMQKPVTWIVLLAGAAAVIAGAYFMQPMDEQATTATTSEPASDTPPDREFRPRPADGVQTMPNGVDYVVLQAGDGEPVESEYLRYEMAMYTADGELVMSSENDGVYTFPVQRLRAMVPALAEAMLATPAGETRRFWIDAAAMRPGYPDMPEQEHVIDVTMLGGLDALPAPDNVAAAPVDARQTDSGIAYVALTEQEGGEHPAVSDTVTVHYTGWTTDGTMFDSSVLRGEPASFPLARLIQGWQQAIPLMTPGDKYRFWIPGELAYDNSPRPGAPKGMLVFDIELLDFEPAEAAATEE